MKIISVELSGVQVWTELHRDIHLSVVEYKKSILSFILNEKSDKTGALHLLYLSVTTWHTKI